MCNREPPEPEFLLSIHSAIALIEILKYMSQLLRGNFSPAVSHSDFNAIRGGLATNNIHVASNGAMF